MYDIEVEDEDDDAENDGNADSEDEEEDAVVTLIGDHAYLDVDSWEEDDDDNDEDNVEQDEHGSGCDSMMSDNEDEVLKSVQEDLLLDVESSTGPWRGYKVVGDNVDKNVRRSFRFNRTTQSLHYFRTYALLDRVDLTGVSDEASNKSITFQSLLPSSADMKQLKEIFTILVSR